MYIVVKLPGTSPNDMLKTKNAMSMGHYTSDIELVIMNFNIFKLS